MSDRFNNLPELSVSELSGALKRTVEEAYGRVRVRGEISGFKRAASGHLYMAIKDENAVLDGVCWRGTAGRLPIRPEDGLEVIATGRITTYPGRSKYQIVIEDMEAAGEGALLKLLEERRRKLAEEGLFAEERKRPLPYLPEVIGVVTSPTGAVIRDILHRLNDRFPRRVLIWPVIVQGDGAAEKVAAAIAGFNRLEKDGMVPRPDLLIVARGGGSLEDLWAFNEEVVVRAAAASDIPLISAVGHETDTTLIDFASDRRAPTPTAAAEIAVPVRADLMAEVADRGRRLDQASHRGLDQRRQYLEGLGRGLSHPRRLLESASQRLDDGAERLVGALPRLLKDRGQRLDAASARLTSPAQMLRRMAETLSDRSARLLEAGPRAIERPAMRFADSRAGVRMDAAIEQRLGRGEERLGNLARQLENLSYRRVLERGYSVVRDPDGKVVSRVSALPEAGQVSIQFADGAVDAALGGAVVTEAGKPSEPAPQPKRKPRAKPSPPVDDQGSLF